MRSEPHILGHFRELVMATLTHPAMLQYLDNAQNAVNHVNENYARELMELHTLGVGAGYTQADVQNLARILTGVGINAAGPEPKLKAEWQGLYRREGAFEFNPARHDFGAKILLGHSIRRARVCGGGAGRRHSGAPAGLCAVRIAQAGGLFRCRRSCAGAGDTHGGDLLAHRRRHRSGAGVMFASPEFAASLGAKFKDPMHFVVSAVRLAYDARPIINTHPVVNWLNALGEPLYSDTKLRTATR